jgi:hypothetical protein
LQALTATLAGVRPLPVKERHVNYLSDTNLRAVLIVLVARTGGSVEISNEELYDAMMPAGGGGERFHVADTPSGVRVSIRPSQQEQAGSN